MMLQYAPLFYAFMPLSIVLEMQCIYYHYFWKQHMVLTIATIYYYEIDTKTYEQKVTKLAYSQDDGCFYIDNELHDCHIKAFEKKW